MYVYMYIYILLMFNQTFQLLQPSSCGMSERHLVPIQRSSTLCGAAHQEGWAGGPFQASETGVRRSSVW